MGSAPLTFRPYWDGDIGAIDIRAEQSIERAAKLRPQSHVRADLGAQGAPAQTALRGKEIVASAGLYPTWPGRAIAWAFFSDLRPREWVQVTVRLGEVLATQPFERIEATAAADFPQAVMFLERLGFRREGLLRSYVAGQDYYMMARVAE